MRRLFVLLLLTPLLANCSDSATPVAPAGAMLTEGDWPTEEGWIAQGELLVEDEFSVQSANAPKVMVFGNPDAGTNYPPGVHDQSFHAKDRIIPGTVVIDAGETVTFQVFPAHRVAIYDDGMRPEDIQRTPGHWLLYPTGRLFLQPAPVPQFTLKFVRPGKYLVICAINSHFFEANMWGWVIVR